ncbi:MAG TPA: PqqD family protein [Candidatus Thermoplasmatota archaeon]|nr:PqqD family protein [Candidatus Thermoplasmatota archaeon]
MERIPDASRAVPRKGEVQERQEDGQVVLVRRRFGWLRRGFLRMVRVDPDLTVRLDLLGAAAWQLIDGERTVAQLHAELQRRFPAQDDLAGRLGRFLGTMVSRGFVLLG